MCLISFYVRISRYSSVVLIGLFNILTLSLSVMHFLKIDLFYGDLWTFSFLSSSLRFSSLWIAWVQISPPKKEWKDFLWWFRLIHTVIIIVAINPFIELIARSRSSATKWVKMTVCHKGIFVIRYCFNDISPLSPSLV